MIEETRLFLVSLWHVASAVIEEVNGSICTPVEDREIGLV